MVIRNANPGEGYAATPDPITSGTIWKVISVHQSRIIAGRPISPMCARLRRTGCNCVVIDLHCRLVVGWSMSAVQDRQLVLQAVLMALWQRKDHLPLILHSDRNCPFTSDEYQRFLKGHNQICSMRAVGSCADTCWWKDSSACSSGNRAIDDGIRLDQKPGRVCLIALSASKTRGRAVDSREKPKDITLNETAGKLVPNPTERCIRHTG